MRLQEHIDECVELLSQAAEVIARLDDDVFTAVSPISPRGSIGGHLRHILDFYSSFAVGVEHSQIDYNTRLRNTEVEQDRFAALKKIDDCAHRLRGLKSIRVHEHVLVSTEDGSGWSKSSVLRELDFLKSHTIHHYALIAMILRLHEVNPGEEFGVAPSTLRHWGQEAVCAQ